MTKILQRPWIALAALMLLALTVAACGGAQPQPTATPEPTATPALGDVWAKVQREGKLVAGV